jgi:hypothetical protein
MSIKMIKAARLILGMAVTGTMLALPAPVVADTYPMLEQLNRETQSLYRDVQAGLVRVQLPTPKWIRDAAAKDDPLTKWNNVIDPKVRARIDQQRKENAANGVPKKLEPIIVSPTPTTKPAATPPKADSGAGAWQIVKTEPTGEIVFEPKSSGGAAMVLHAGPDGGPPNANIGGPLQLKPIAGGTFAPNNIGLLIDDLGHVLVPLFIERETIGNASINVMVADQQTTCKFVGSDDKTNVTLLKMDKVIGRPVRIGFGRPIDGSMVMMLNPNSGSARVQLWTGGERDFGVVVSMDGSVAGFARFGQFLGAANAKPVIDQLIAAGKVQRAILGVRLTEVRPDDRARQRLPRLGQRPALLVDEVTPGSPAEKAGLKAGDFILELDGQKVGDLTSWSALLARGGPGRLVVFSNGEYKWLRLELRRPQQVN